MKISKKTTREQLAAIVVQKLEERKISAVLVGGAVVSIYTENKYESSDLDFISSAEQSEIRSAMEELGFISAGREFIHSKNGFTIEFPAGPIAIGNDEPVKPEGKLKVGNVIVKLFSPTQSAMDRLAWFYHYNDRQCLDQAVMLFKSQPVDMKKIEAWSKRENSTEKFEVFLKRCKARE